MIPPPVACRPEAYWAYVEQLPRLETTEGLWKAATALSMHALEQASTAEVDRRLEGLAARVRAGAPSGRQLSLFTHLHHVLFDQEGFAGNFEDYHRPQNNYLPAVLESRRGMPILLALVYKAVGERVGLNVEGINSPGHFLARTRVDGRWHLIDPFFHGQLLTVDEALSRLMELNGGGSDDVDVESAERLLRPATHAQWIGRVLNNLLNTLSAADRPQELSAMAELRKLLETAL